MKEKRVLVPFILLILLSAQHLVAGLPVTGGVDVQQEWYTEESEHFRVVFPLHLSDLAVTVKEEAEWVYHKLSSWSGYTSEERIDIVITDNSDLANGFVRLGSRGFYITLYAVLPYQDSVDGSDAYRSWYRNILIHELAHIVHFDNVSGFPRFVNAIFGRLFYPNATTPRYYREGFATYAETIHESGYGRGSYAYTDMFVRAAIEEGNPPLLDRASSRTGVWPAGTAPYLYGVSFVDYIAKNNGEKTLFEYNDATSKKILFKGSIAFKEIYEKRLSEAWNDWLEYENKRIEGAAVGQNTALSAVSSQQGWVYSLAVDKSGERAVYSIRPTDSLGGLYLYDFSRDEERCIKRGLYCEDLVFSPDGDAVYYIRGDLRKNVYYENNIYELNLEERRERQISESGHVQGFVLTGRDGEFLICSSSPYGTAIHLRDPEAATKLLLVPGTEENGLPVMEQPALSPDGDLVALSCKDGEGKRSIYTVSIESLKKGEAYLRKITPDGQNAYSPAWLSNSEILWVGDEGGVYNIFRINMDNGSLDRITVVGTGVFDPAACPDGRLLLREYTSKGFRVSMCPLDIIGNRPAGSTTTVIPSEPAGVLITASEKRPAASREQSSGDAFEPYDPSQWLLPGYWSPFFLDDRVSLGVGFYTSAQDLIGRHAYRAGVLYDLFDEGVKSFVDYTYYSYPFNYFFSLYAFQRTDTGAFSPKVALFPGISFPLIRRNFSLKIDLGVVVEDPYAGIDLSLLYSDAKAPAHWIGPEKGIVFEQGVYYNMAQDSFFILTDYLSWYIRVLDPFLLNFRVVSRWDPGGGEERVRFGVYSEYVYAPLNGIYTRGYPEAVPARFAADLRATLSLPLLTVDRGIGALPFFFEGAKLSFFFDNGMAVSQAENPDFLVGSLQELFDDPGGHIRSSIGPQLELDFIIGYDYPLTFEIGYIYPLSSGGSSGIFLEARFDLLL